MSIKELELAVSKLSSEELTSFAQWFEEFMADSAGSPNQSGYFGRAIKCCWKTR